MINTTPTMPRRLVKGKEAAAYLCLSERTLWNLTKTGAIPSVKLARAVRYDLADLDSFIQGAKTRGICTDFQANADLS